MKLKNIFMCVAATTVLFGCSDDEPFNEQEELAPTTMSIRIDADGTIISKAETDQTIKNLYVLIFNSNDTFYKVDQLLPSEEEPSDVITEGDQTTAENVEIEVKEGAHKVLVIANVKDEAAFIQTALTGKSLSDVQDMQTRLDSETDGNLTMSSEVMQVTFLGAVKNLIGYDVIPSGSVNAYPSLADAVKLYRSVARVQLSQITLGPSADETAYGTPVRFALTSVFLANVKGHSQLASSDNEKLSIEATAAPDDKLWWYGDWSEFDAKDILKKIAVENTYESSLLGVGTSGSGKTIYVNLDQEHLSFPAVANSNPITTENYGHLLSFYAYENEIYDDKTPGGVGYQTLLILKGDYTYEKDGQTETAVDRYYAIPVNVAGTNEDNSEDIIRTHKGVIRNTIYDLRVTITGPGSELPYQPDAHLYYNAQVNVADWERVDVGTPDDPKEVN